MRVQNECPFWAESGLAAAQRRKRVLTVGRRHSRPVAALGYHFQTMQCGPPLRPFVRNAAALSLESQQSQTTPMVAS